MLGNKVIAAFEKLCKNLFISPAFVCCCINDGLESCKAYLLIDSCIFELFLCKLREVCADIDHTVGDDTYCLTVEVNVSLAYTCLLDFVCLLFCDKLAGLCKDFACCGADNHISKCATCKSVRNSKLLVVLVTAYSGEVVTVRIEEEVVEVSLSCLD